MQCIELSQIDGSAQSELLTIARQAIRNGMERPDSSSPTIPDITSCQPSIRKPGCAFVTLLKNGELRGCIGALKAQQALACDVAEHARAAAFRDPRFPPLRAEELPQIRIAISVIGPTEAFPVQSERDLLDQLRPFKDGLILELDDPHSHISATFLPSVWEQLPSPPKFVNALKRKAGLPEVFWSKNLQFKRYTTLSFSEPESR